MFDEKLVRQALARWKKIEHLNCKPLFHAQRAQITVFKHT